MEIAPYISVDPNVHHGKVVISGTTRFHCGRVPSRWDEPRRSNAGI